MAQAAHGIDALGDAAKLIARSIQPGALALPDIKSRLPPRDAPYDEHSAADDAWAPFSVLRRLPIPSVVFETITSRAPVATLALFPEIARACITVENRLYLWNYTEGQAAFEYHELPQDEVILAAGLVRAKPGVFIKEIQHVLVLATGPTSLEGRRVQLLGVEHTAGAGAKSAAGAGGELKLYETGLTAPTNGVVLRELKGTAAGRVFAIGSDQCVYEVVYQATEGWFSSRCYVSNVTQPRLSNLVPSLFRSEKRIDHLALDSARSLLYVLRQGDQIDVYRLPSADASRAPTHVGTMYGIAHHAGLLHSPQEVGPMVWLGPTEPDTRTSACLVAVTERGYRIYFDDFQRRSWAQLSVRIPPGGVVPPAGGAAVPMLGGMQLGVPPPPPPLATQRRTTTALYAAGIFLEAFATPDGGSALYAVAPSAPGGVAGTWQEAAMHVALGHGASAPVLAEVRTAAATRATEANGGVMRANAAQAVAPPRVFLLLDSNGLTELVERRPADVLLGLLGGGGVGAAGVASTAPPVIDYFNRFGSVEASMSALAIAARNSHLSPVPTLPGGSGAGGAAPAEAPAGAPRAALGDDSLTLATRVFFGPLGAWPADSRMPSALSASKTSRHEALVYYLGCLVRETWEQRLVPAAWVAPKAAGGPVVAAGALDALLRELIPLHQFMLRHTQLFELGAEAAPPAAGMAPPPTAAPALRAERDDFFALRALVARTIEAAQFLLFLQDHALQTLVQALVPDVRARLGALRFVDLVTTSEGSVVASELVTALIESQDGARASVEAIADALQARCASFCSTDDVRRYKASECLRNAVQTDKLLRAQQYTLMPDGTSDERQQAIDEDLASSLRLLLASAAQLPFGKLEQLCATYTELGFVRGVLSLALACARASDPGDTAVAFRAEGCAPEEGATPRRAAYEQRRRMYQLVLDALHAIDVQLDEASAETDAAQRAARLERASARRAEAYELARTSDDPLFHEELYTWLIAQRRTDQLLELRTPFLEEFLAGTPVVYEGEASAYVRRLRDLLWQLYVRRGDYLAAAQTLDELAHSDEFALRLSERIEYLALAVGNAKSIRSTQAERVRDLVAFSSQVEEDLEVAQVQAKVRAALQPLDDHDAAERAQLESAAQWLDTQLLDVTALWKEVAEPFDLLEEKLLLLHTAQYQDLDLVAAIWRALIAREHNACAPEYANQAVAALVGDLLSRLGYSDTACPLDLLLALLEQYALDHELLAAGEEPTTADWLDWTAATRAALPPGTLPVGWAPLVLFHAGASPEVLFDVLQGLIANAPPPWNTNRGLGFLIPDAAAYLAKWLDAVLGKDHTDSAATAPYFPADRVDEAVNEYLLKLNTRKFLRPGISLDACIAMLHDVHQRIQRSF